MKRTNIYLREDQSVALQAASRVKGVTCAHLVRQMIDRDLAGAPNSSLEADFEAIERSFGVLAPDGVVPERRPDERARHLERVRGR